MHNCHDNVRNRLKRARGHLNKVVEMIEDGRPCVLVAQQLQALVKALDNAKRLFVEDHIDNCISAERKKNSKSINEIKEIARYL